MVNNDGALIKTVPGGPRLLFFFFFFFLLLTPQTSCCVLSESPFVPRKERTNNQRARKIYTTTERYAVVKYAIASGSSNCLMIKLVYIMWALSGGGV